MYIGMYLDFLKVGKNDNTFILSNLLRIAYFSLFNDISTFVGYLITKQSL